MRFLIASFCLFPVFLVSSFLSGSPVRSPLDTENGVDGPAELPRIYLRTALGDTPAPGKVHSVRQGENLQSAIDNAKCGDTLKLQAGATFQGVFRLPNKPCGDAHWIIIRTSAADESLPPEGTRITPCYSGLSSLPGRPDFHCTATGVVTAKIAFPGKGGSGPLVLLAGANHYRLLGLEITRSQDTAASVNSLVSVQAAQQGNTASHIVLDRVWLHGNAQDETARGVQLNGTTQVSVIDSYFSDFHCIAVTGSCTDAQAIAGGGGDTPAGPYKIVNNFLEGSGENILFGGAPGTSTPVDIEIRRNHLFKPMSWKRGQPGFVGGASGQPFIVKNHFELKNAQRVLFEGNVLENAWGGFSQAGFSILITPKNQANRCPACRVTDVTIRYDKITHVGSALQIANALSDAKGPATAGERYSIHDLIVDDIDAVNYQGFGLFALIVSTTPPLKNVRIDHVTAFPTRDLISFLNFRSNPQIENLSITNSIFAATPRQLSSAGGGPNNCAFRAEQLQPEGVLKNCLPNSVFSHNVIVGGKGKWPPDNILVKPGDAGQFQGGSQLKNSKLSSARNIGTDGKNIGADLQAVARATEGVL
jgi:hypothetical protein